MKVACKIFTDPTKKYWVVTPPSSRSQWFTAWVVMKSTF